MLMLTSCMTSGIGYCMITISGLVCIYYNVIITWTLYYLFKSFAAKLPWSTCDNEWNTDQCALQSRGNASLFNETGIATTTTQLMATASTVANETLKIKLKSPSEEFWE